MSSNKPKRRSSSYTGAYVANRAYNASMDAADERGHLARTQGGAIGGLVGAVAGSFLGIFGAGLGAGVGATIGAAIGEAFGD